MAQPSISAVGLSKRYRRSRAGSDWIDAVRDVSFEIESGEGVGLIGRNGAGKSTLLRILARVTRPSAGHADVYGRVGALLEVGTGFHPDLTGRENTYLSGAMLGLSKSEVRARFDDIVDFAEIAPYIDMPVKRYSSGMYARLGFAVAAFLKPAILIVDEVLSVGDLAFQAKCLAYMHGLRDDGTTVLFVSHNLLAVADFCPRAIVMATGSLVFDGTTADAMGTYRRSLAETGDSNAVDGRPSHGLMINGEPAGETIECRPNDPMRIELDVDQRSEEAGAIVLNLVIETPDGRKAIHLRSDVVGNDLELRPGPNTLTIDIDDLALGPGRYTLWLRVVGLETAPPIIWDTDRLAMVVIGDQRLDSVAQPRHRFGQRTEHSEAPFGPRT